MIGATMCSGIGAPELAAPWVDWVLASEIEAFPRQVLETRHGYVDATQAPRRLMGDFTKIALDDYPEIPELLVAWTPCQAFSLAGLREGVDDDRGNLTLEFVRKVHDIVRRTDRLTVVWENVPGVLSDKGNAFGSFLGGLVGADDALPNPIGGSWPSEGMVEGPGAWIAWRVLDAQHFGVPQRRYRVFLVASFGTSPVDPAKVLFEPKGLRGNTTPRRKAWKGATDDVARGTVSGKQTFPTLMANCGDKQWLGNQEAFSGDYHIAEPIAFDCKCSQVQTSETGIAPPLRSMNNYKSNVNGGGHSAIAYGIQATAVDRDPKHGGNGLGFKEEQAPTLTVADRHAVAYSFDSLASNSMKSSNPNSGCNEVEIAKTLDTTRPDPSKNQGGIAIVDFAVRRLTPAECARLQGFPDDFLDIEFRGKPASDTVKYKALGNSMAVPVVKWIMDRIKSQGGASQ